MIPVVTRKHVKKPEKERAVAQERIARLFHNAEQKSADRPDLAMRYVELARKIAMKYKVKLPNVLKRKFCKSCHSFFIPGKNLRIRVSDKKVVYYCLTCKNYMRFPYGRVRAIK